MQNKLNSAVCALQRGAVRDFSRMARETQGVCFGSDTHIRLSYCCSGAELKDAV